MILNEPIDRLHAECLSLREILNRWFDELKEETEQWELPPNPPKQ